MVARGWGRATRELLVNGERVSLLLDGKSSGGDGVDSSTTI